MEKLSAERERLKAEDELLNAKQERLTAQQSRLSSSPQNTLLQREDYLSRREKQTLSNLKDLNEDEAIENTLLYRNKLSLLEREREATSEIKNEIEMENELTLEEEIENIENELSASDRSASAPSRRLSSASRRLSSYPSEINNENELFRSASSPSRRISAASRRVSSPSERRASSPSERRLSSKQLLPDIPIFNTSNSVASEYKRATLPKNFELLKSALINADTNSIVEKLTLNSHINNVLCEKGFIVSTLLYNADGKSYLKTRNVYGDIFYISLYDNHHTSNMEKIKLRSQSLFTQDTLNTCLNTNKICGLISVCDNSMAPVINIINKTEKGLLEANSFIYKDFAVDDNKRIIDTLEADATSEIYIIIKYTDIEALDTEGLKDLNIVINNKFRELRHHMKEKNLKKSEKLDKRLAKILKMNAIAKIRYEKIITLFSNNYSLLKTNIDNAIKENNSTNITMYTKKLIVFNDAFNQILTLPYKTIKDFDEFVDKKIQKIHIKLVRFLIFVIKHYKPSMVEVELSNDIVKDIELSKYIKFAEIKDLNIEFLKKQISNIPDDNYLKQEFLQEL